MMSASLGDFGSECLPPRACSVVRHIRAGEIYGCEDCMLSYVIVPSYKLGNRYNESYEKAQSL